MALKSAWELALERTGGKTTGTLSSEQKAKLAELERVYIAKIAQVELDLKPKIASAQDAEEIRKLQETLRTQIQKLRHQLEEKKEAVRSSH